MSSEKIKLEWVDIGIPEWYEDHIEEILFIVKGSETPISHGYFKGYNELSREQINSIDSYECLYYYGKECTKENEEAEECECCLGREFSSLEVKYFCCQYDDIVEECIKPMLGIED